MERITIKNSKGLNLVGNFYSANSDKVILLLHGFTGDKSEFGRFDKTAEALNNEGYNVLNFDFSGSGESDDDSLTVNKQIDDLKCVIRHLQNNGLNNIAILGLSLGGLVSLKTYDEKINARVLWAPVTDKVKYSWGKRYSSEQLQELKEKGYITKIKDKGIRRKIIIDKQMLKDRDGVEQEMLCSKIKCPVLILHGDKDSTVPLQDSKNAMKYLPKGSALKIIPEADHMFLEQLDQFIKESISWFKEYF